MNAGNADDEIGVRGTAGNNLAYATNGYFRWFGAGVLGKPIGDFDFGPEDSFRRFWNEGGASSKIYFDEFSGGIIMDIHRNVIPEPKEYALVFGLFALGFFVFRRRFQKKELRNEQ